MRTRHTLAALVAAVCLFTMATTASALPPFSVGQRVSPPTGNTLQAELHGLKIFCHPTFDRFVIRARYGTPGYRVQYVPQIIHDSSGELIQLLGTRRLRVIVRPARAHTEIGSSLVPNVVTANCPQLLQLKNAGDFEGIVTIGIGVKQLRPFRVFRLANPTRIVIDIQH